MLSKKEREQMKVDLTPLVKRAVEKKEGHTERTIEWWTDLFTDIAVEVIDFLDLKKIR